MKSSKLLKIAIPAILVIIIAAASIIRFNHTRTHFTQNYQNGNTGGNLYNGGYFCEYDGVIYFSNPNDHLALYCISRTGGELKKLSDDRVAYINVDDNYIYYTRNNSDVDSSFSFLNIQACSLCRIDRSTGENKKYLDGDPCLYSCQVGDYIYYIHYDKKDASTLYRVKIDGSNREQILKEPALAVSSDEQYLYYAGTKSEHDLHRINTTNSTNTTICSGTFYNPVIQDGYVYYMDSENGYSLTKMKIDTQEKTVISSDRVDCFNINGSYLYYQRNSSSPALCRIKTDGTEFEEIYAGNYANINVTSSYVYFSSFNDTDTFYYTPTTGKINVSIFSPQVIEED